MGLAVPDLSVCPGCQREFIYPAQWHEVEESHWLVALQCANCGLGYGGQFDNATMEAFEDRLDDHLVMMQNELQRLEADRFAAALEADAILPEDF